MKINFYDGNIKNTKKAQIITIAEFLNKVKYETYKVQSDEIASITDKKARQKRKAEILPYVTISGVFSERNESGLLEHSGFFNPKDARDLVKIELATGHVAFIIGNNNDEIVSFQLSNPK